MPTLHEMILITGASGLLGSELLRRFVAEGRVARGIDLRSPQDSLFQNLIQIGDLMDVQACTQACRGVRTLVHCAARQHQDAPRFGRRAYFSANRTMTAQIVASAVAAGAEQIVCVSSDMVYGLPPNRPLRESDPPRPIGPYGESKLASESVCSEARERGVRVTILRPRLIIGPGRLGVLKRLFDAVRSGRRIPMIGDGSTRYQMVAVADVADACVRAIDARVDGTFNLGSAAPPSVRKLLTELCSRAGTKARPMGCPALAVTGALSVLDVVRLSPLVPEQFRIAPLDYVLDIRAAQRELGWTARLSDVEMLWQAYQVYCGTTTGSESSSGEDTGVSAELPLPSGRQR